jgi:DNA-binding NarL/FixJ family response regulator
MTEIRVILADDHPVVRAGIRDLLDSTEDISVIAEAVNGVEALAKIQELKPDVLLLDMEMPDMNGLEVSAKIKEDKHPVKVLALSAYDSVHFIQSTLKAGAYGYLTKEEMPETILEAIRGVAKGVNGWLSQRAKARMAKYLTDEEAPFSRLSEREQEIVKLIGQGYDNLTISSVLNISERTVRNHASNVYNKLGFHTRAELVAWAWDYGILK